MTPTAPARPIQIAPFPAEMPGLLAEAPVDRWPSWCDERWEVGGTAPITSRQLDVLEYIVRFRRERGYGPTFREILAGLGMTINALNSIHEIVRALRSKSLIAPAADPCGATTTSRTTTASSLAERRDRVLARGMANARKRLTPAEFAALYPGGGDA